MDLPIPATVIALDPVLQPALAWAMRKLAEGRRSNWRGVSWRRDAGSLNGILPSPANSTMVLLEDGSALRLSQHLRTHGGDIDIALQRLEGDHFNHHFQARGQFAAAHLLREDSWVIFFQHPGDSAARAEIVLSPEVGGHGAFEALERLNRDFPGLLAIPGLEPTPRPS